MQARILTQAYFVEIDGVKVRKSNFYPCVLELTKRNKKYYFFPHGFPRGMMIREECDKDEVIFLEETALPTLQDLDLQLDFYIAACESGNETEIKKRAALIEMICLKQYDKEFNTPQTSQ